MVPIKIVVVVVELAVEFGLEEFNSIRPDDGRQLHSRTCLRCVGSDALAEIELRIQGAAKKGPTVLAADADKD